jgi:hypothetical protein
MISNLKGLDLLNLKMPKMLKRLARNYKILCLMVILLSLNYQKENNLRETIRSQFIRTKRRSKLPMELLTMKNYRVALC